MRTYIVEKSSEPYKSFRCQKAANSLDIDVEKKLTHKLKIEADIEGDFSIGVIAGASGSGKTTLAAEIYGEECLKPLLNKELPIIEQLPKDMSYDECAKVLSGVGLTSVPCWIKPAGALSNGQQARAEAALKMCTQEFIVIDEWTSVVDRTVAKVMSSCIAKYAKRTGKKVVLVSCHYDVIAWLDPDWVIDCNEQKFINDRGSLRQKWKKDKLKFEIRRCTKEPWSYFSKFHYLSEKLPGGRTYYFGLFIDDRQVGFICFANYIPKRRNDRFIVHANRIVVSPDYCGFGLGLKLTNECCKLMKKEFNYKLMIKFSSIPLYKAMSRDTKNWRPHSSERVVGKSKYTLVKEEIAKQGRESKFGRISGEVDTFRGNVVTWSFRYIGE